MDLQMFYGFSSLGMFDYDVYHDRLELAGAAVGAANGRSVIEHFQAAMDSQQWIPEDMKKWSAGINGDLEENPEGGVLEYEADFDGKGKRWYRMRYKGITDGRGALSHIIGISSDIQEEHSKVSSWKKLAREDTMTGLLNHEAVVSQTGRAIRKNGGGALLLLDIDDFKKINDTLGHLQGDLVLKRVAETIRRLFRRDDIVGRYGGDEFIVFLPGVKDPHFVRRKAEGIINGICRIRLPELEQAACSIGIAIAENAEASSEALFKQADFALYEAKTFGKGHYVIIENGQAIHQEQAEEVCARERENDEAQADQLAGALFSRLYRGKTPEEGIQAALAYVGQRLGLSRVYIFEQVEGGPIARNTFEWCNKGIEPEIDHLQAVDTREPGMNFYAHYDEDDMWVCLDVQLLPVEQREFLEAQHIHSMMHWGFRRNGRYAGMIGFDECTGERIWGSRYAQILKRAGETISEYLMSYRAKITSMDGLSERELFEGLSNTSDNVYLFVCDMKRNFSKWSDNAVRYFGLPADYGTHTMEVWVEHIHPEDRAVYLEDIDKVFSGKRPRHYCQYRAVNAAGDYVWMECTGNVITDAEGNGAYFVGLMTRLDHQSKFDPVTKCLSIQQFYQAGPEKACILLLIGMDEFRRVVNNFGYEAGNRVLAGVVKVLWQLAPGVSVYRMTGDEFLLILPDGSEMTAYSFFTRALEAVQKEELLSGDWKKLSFSGGAVHFLPGENDKETAIRQLEHSMEHAKSCGSGSFAFYSRHIEESHIRARKIKDALYRAIENGYEGFELYYQTIHWRKDHSVYGVEGLLRFHTPELGMISPAEFIPVLEETREIRRVGAWVMEQAIAQKARWREKYPEMVVGFNASYLQLAEGDFVERLTGTAERYQVDPGQIVVELTESCKVEYLEELTGTLKQLMDCGFIVALDDFGMENASLALIREIPLSYIKIDHSFVSTLTRCGMRQKKVNLAIISSVVFLCKHLGIRVVVEGVENEETNEMIGKMDVDFLQGFYYSHPVPPEEAEKLF